MSRRLAPSTSIRVSSEDRTSRKLGADDGEAHVAPGAESFG
jgi:hypothetical protein